jgi:hypothetical protein
VEKIDNNDPDISVSPCWGGAVRYLEDNSKDVCLYIELYESVYSCAIEVNVKEKKDEDYLGYFLFSNNDEKYTPWVERLGFSSVWKLMKSLYPWDYVAPDFWKDYNIELKLAEEEREKKLYIEQRIDEAADYFDSLISVLKK